MSAASWTSLFLLQYPFCCCFSIVKSSKLSMDFGEGPSHAEYMEVGDSSNGRSTIGMDDISVVDNNVGQDPMGKLSEDDLMEIFAFLPFYEKVKCERVSVKWRTVAGRIIATQKSLGNAPTKLTLVDHCRERKHWITQVDCIPKYVLTNLSVLPKILVKCPDLRALSISDPKEPVFTEMTEPPKASNDPSSTCQRMKTLVDSVTIRMMTEWATDHDPENAFEIFGLEANEHVSNHQRARSIADPFILQKMKKLKTLKVEPRPTTQEDFFGVVAKYSKMLECIDVSGLKLLRGHRADLGEGGSLQILVDGCPNLVHVKTMYLRDRELEYLINKTNLSDISVVYGLKGDALRSVRPCFRKMCIPSIKEYGLNRLLEAPNLSGLKEISLQGVNRNIVSMISKIRTLDSVNLSLAANNIDPMDLCCLCKLSNLERLYVKRREPLDIFDKFDRPMTDIISQCTSLTSIKLFNVVVTDSSLRCLSYSELYSLTRISIKLPDSSKTNVTLTDRSLHAFGNVKLLQKLEIDYPNTFTENTMIDFLFGAYNLRLLFIHGCKELIPIHQIALAAMRQATSEQRGNRILTIDIDTRERMEIGPMKHLFGFKPRNLEYTISTALDMFSTVFPDGRPNVQSDDADFDEHTSYIVETLD